MTHDSPTPNSLPPDLFTAISAMIDPVYIPAWLEKPHPLFGGRTPEELIFCGETWRIWEAIERLQSGDYL